MTEQQREVVYPIEHYAVRLWLRPERDAKRGEARSLATLTRLWDRWQGRSGYLHATPSMWRDTDPATGKDYLVSGVRCIKAPEDEATRQRMQAILDRRPEQDMVLR